MAAELNGMPLTPDADVPSQFTFKCTSNIHFQAIFEEAKDVVSVSGAEEVASAQLTGGADVVDIGNVALTISDDTDYDAANALQIVNGTKVASLDVLIDQIIAKAGNLNEEEQRLARAGTIKVTEDKFWKNNLTELAKPVDIQLDLDNITLAANETLAMVRDHNGTCEKIPVTVGNENGKVNVKFSSDKFSTYTIVKENAESDNGSHGGTNTGGSSSGGSSSGGSSSSGTTDTTKPSNDSNKENSNTTTETKPDGSKVETTTETKADGSKTEIVVETSKDGAVKTTETVTKADGSATKTEKETETNAKGKEVAVTTTTKTDATGEVTSITEKSVIAQSSATTSTTVTVKKDAKGEITAATASIANTVKSGNKATVSAEIVAQIVEAAGTSDVRVSMTVKDAEGKTKYTVKVEAENLKAGEELFIYKLDTKTGKYTMVNAKAYEVSKDGSVAVSMSKKATYELVNAKDAAKISKEIKNSIKPKKASASV